MADRYRYPSGRRSPTYNPARVSMPSMSYSSMYGGDIHVVPTSRYESSTSQQQPRGHHSRHNSGSDWRGANVPITTTTYTVRKDPVSRSSSVREHSRNRSSTVDAAPKRPPIIVTTRQSKEPASSSSHTPSSHIPATTAPPAPPVTSAPERGRDNYRSSNEDYYTLPASSTRSRSHTRPYPPGSGSSTLDNEEFLRLRQRTNDERPPPSRNENRRERPVSMYANPPRHNTTTVDLGDSGYEYTTPSALARYDLDNDKPNLRRRRDSFDRSTYYRPSVSVSTDISRPPYDARSRGPPPTTWGLDKVNRRVNEDPPAGIYDRPPVRVPAPPVVPLPIPDRRSSQIDVPPSPIERRPSRTGHRPVSLYQDGAPRSSHHDDVYRGRDDEFVTREREARDRDYFREDNVGNRGFGLRVEGDKKDDYTKDRERDDLVPTRERRSEQRRESRLEDREREPKRREESVDRRADRKYSRDQGRKDDEARQDRKGSKDDSVREDSDKKLRDKVATGLSIAAGAIGLGGALGHKDKEEKEEKGSPRRRVDDEARKDEAEERYKPPKKDLEERGVLRDDDTNVSVAGTSRKDRDDAQDKERNRRNAESRLAGESNAARDGNSSSDESKPRRRPRPEFPFKPNDTASLMALKEQLKAKEESDKENDKATSKDPSPDRRSRNPSPFKRDPVENLAKSSKEDVRGREAAPPAGDERQVRLVSPPRDKDDKKPIKGILKQPKPSFPEEPNPVREGVAPHKDDKTKSNVPTGARWTKISRKLVNPDALTIGKERFEVRDDFVIVLRVLNKDEIEAYTAATAQLREMRRKEFEREQERDKDDDRDDDDDDKRRPHRSHRRDPRDEEEDDRRRREERREREREKEREREPRSRRHRYEEDRDEEPPRQRAIEYQNEDDRDRFPYRSHRHREREREKEPVSVRGGDDD